jgi:hypothetical protein
MIPRFDSKIAMISYFNSIKDKNFADLLEEEFNIPVPVGAPKYQSEYLYKYLVQGMSFFNKTGDELIKYAVDQTEKLVRIYPALKLKGVHAPAEKSSQKFGKPARVVNKKQVDGTVLFLEHRQVWVGYFGGVIRCTRKTEKAVRDFLSKKFSVLTKEMI